MQEAVHAEKIKKLVTLACEGKWQQVLDLSGKYKATAAAAQDISQDSLLSLLDTPEHVQHNAPHHRNSGVDELQLQQLLQQQLEAELSYSTFKILALMRLRRHPQASLEFQQLGHLPQQQLAGSRRCSMPFGLLYLRALLPAHLGDTDLSLDLLYELQSYCQQQMTDHLPCTHQQESRLVPALANSCHSQERQQQQQQQHLLPDERIADAGPGVGDQSPKDMIQAQNSFMQQQQQPNHPNHPNHKTNLPSKFPTSQAPTPAAPQLGDVWYQRWQGVSCQLISHHWQQHSVAAAFAQLELLLAAAPTNVLLWSLAGRMQLQLHLSAAAHRSFETAQQLVQQEGKKLQQQRQQQQQLQTDHHQQHDMSSSCSSLGAAAAANRSPATSTPSWELGLLQQAVLLNWGCYHALANDMEAAAASFESVRGVLEEPEQRPGLNTCSNLVSVAAANSAVCLMYSSQLTEAISAIEAGLQGDQPLLLQECTLRNLGVLYDLAYPAASGRQARHSMASRLLRRVSDDFDLSCIEPPQQQQLLQHY